MAGEGEITCSNRECRVAESGRCVEGLERSVCPHYGHLPEEEEVSSGPNRLGEESVGLALPGADTLTPASASRILRSHEARVVAILGPKGAGKTSLIASLYDLLQEGAVGGAEYARSETLHAFELACHDARAVSRRGEPEMERTPFGEVRFYHLDLVGGPAGAGVGLLLGDRAGEEYRLAADNVGNLDPFPEIRRADTLTVLIDGQRLLDPGARHNLRSETTMILQALADGGVLREGQALTLVLTKLDEIETSPQGDRAKIDFDSLHGQIVRLFGDRFSHVTRCFVAASPKNSTVPRGTGVADVLASWVVQAVTAPTVVPELPISLRAFSRLTPVGQDSANG